MGSLRLVGSLKLQVSFEEYRLFYRALLQKRPMILRSLLIEATPYHVHLGIYWYWHSFIRDIRRRQRQRIRTRVATRNCCAFGGKIEQPSKRARADGGGRGEVVECRIGYAKRKELIWCSVVQCGAGWCSVVQGGAGWCSVVQCGVVQRVAVCCSVV